MGCASSGPLFEKGKNLVEGVKETANDTVIKGEKVLNDTTDTIKDGISSGLESVKETVQGALNTAEESVENVANKIGQNFHHHLTTSSSNDLMDNVKNNALKNKEDLFNSASETAAEAVSETETLILTEVDQAKEAFQSGTSPLFETIHSLGNNMEINGQEAIKEIQQNGENLQESLKDKGEEIVEDLESKTRNFLGESVRKNSLIPMEELLRDELNNKEDNKKEE